MVGQAAVGMGGSTSVISNVDFHFYDDLDGDHDDYVYGDDGGDDTGIEEWRIPAQLSDDDHGNDTQVCSIAIRAHNL